MEEKLKQAMSLQDLQKEADAWIGNDRAAAKPAAAKITAPAKNTKRRGRLQREPGSNPYLIEGGKVLSNPKPREPAVGNSTDSSKTPKQRRPRSLRSQESQKQLAA